MSENVKLYAALAVVALMVLLYFASPRSARAAFGSGLGEACDSDSDCGAGRCGYVTAASGADTVCCAAADYDGFAYCTGQPQGAACWTGAACASGNCARTGPAQGQCM